MKMLRIACSFFSAAVLAVAALGADPTGTWKWATSSPNGEIETTLKLESRDGKLAGAYSNEFGETTISNPSLDDDVLTFDVVRIFGGSKYVVKYRGKLEGDVIKGSIEAPSHDGGKALKLEWNAKRAPKGKSAEAKPKP